MKQQKVVGVKTEHVYFKGAPAECRRFINDHAVTRHNDKKAQFQFGFKGALQITW